MLPIGLPRAYLEVADHVHFIYLLQLPAVLEQGVVGREDEIVQRQRVSVVSGAALVGKSLSCAVACDCTAASASTISAMMRSTGYLS